MKDKLMFQNMATIILEDYARHYREVDKDNLARYIEETFNGYLKVDGVIANEWHTASELPKEDGSYLVFVRSNNGRHCWQNVCKFSTNLTKVHKDDFKGKKRPGWYSYDGEWGYYEIDGITHWKYLPENPREATNE